MPADSEVGRQFPADVVQHADADFDIGESFPLFVLRHVLEGQLGFEPGDQHPPLGQHHFVFEFCLDRDVAVFTQVCGGVDLEPLGRQPLEADGDKGPVRVRFKVMPQTGLEVPEF